MENGGILYVFPVFQTADWGQKIRYPAADDLFRTSLITNFLTFTPFAKAGVRLDACFCAKVVQTARMTSLPLFIGTTPTIDIEPKNNGHTIQRDCVTVLISVVLPTLPRQLFIGAVRGWQPGRQPDGRWAHGRESRKRSSGQCDGRTPRSPGRRRAHRRCHSGGWNG